MIDKVPPLRLEEFVESKFYGSSSIKSIRASVTNLSSYLGWRASVDDLNSLTLEGLRVHMQARRFRARTVVLTISCLRRVWRQAQHDGLTAELPPASGVRIDTTPCKSSSTSHRHMSGLRRPISEPPPEQLTLDSSLLDVALHFAHARQTDVHPKTREHYRGSVRRFERFLGRESCVRDLTDDNIDSLQEWLAVRRKSIFTRENTRWNLRSLWHHLVHEGVLNDLPENFRPVNVPQPPPVDISSVMAIHVAAKQRKAAEELSKPGTVLKSIGGMLKRFVAPPAKPPVIALAAPPEPDRDPDTLTIAELIAAWRVFSENTYDHRERMNMDCGIRPMEAFYGGQLVKDFGPKRLRAVQQLMVDGYDVGEKHYRGIARRQINSRTGRIKRVFRWGVAEELVRPAIFQALSAIGPLKFGRTKAYELAPILPVDDAIIDATLPHLPPVVAAMVQFERFTGCRPGEVCMLRPMDIDRTGDIWLYRPPIHKTAWKGRKRLIYIGAKAQAVLLPFLEGRDPEHHCFSPRESELWRAAKQRLARKSPVQPSQVDRSQGKRLRTVGRAYAPGAYSKAIRRTCLIHGIEPWHPNQLRHSLATTVRRDFGLEAAQVILGHSRADVTQVYAETHGAIGATVMKEIG